MKSRKFVFIIICILSICTFAGVIMKSTIAIAANTEPGSSSDPVVSKSYVDSKINELRNLISNGNIITNSQTTGTDKQQLVDEVLAVVEALYADKIDTLTKSVEDIKGTNTDLSDTEEAFVPVQLSKGQKLIGGEGAEIIFRSGKAVVYTTTQGVIDVSSGKDLENGAEILPNHLLIVGRNDGRGALALTESWFIVKGDYRIE